MAARHWLGAPLPMPGHWIRGLLPKAGHLKEVLCCQFCQFKSHIVAQASCVCVWYPEIEYLQQMSSAYQY